MAEESQSPSSAQWSAPAQAWSGSPSLSLRAGMFGVELKAGAQVLVGRGGYSNDTMKPRCRLIEGEGFPGRITDGAATFIDEQDSGREIPLVFRLDGQDGLDTTGSDQGKCIGDGVHGAALSGLGEGRPSVTPEFPRIDHDDVIALTSVGGGAARVVEDQSAAATR